MMLKELTNNYYDEMMSNIERIIDTDNPQIQIFKNAMLVVQGYLYELKDELKSYQFENQEEEIWFFKIEKPRFYSWFIYYKELFALEQSKPIVNREEVNAYYREHMRYINRFFRFNEFLYQYFLLESDELDSIYFLRNGAGLGPLSASVPMIDSGFGTGSEYLFSTFRGLEMVLVHLNDVISQDNRADDAFTKAKSSASKLKWTGETLHLIELLYAVHGAEQINNGTISIAQLAAKFQEVFQVKLDRYYKRFDEIKRRKGISKSKFTDQLRQIIIDKVDEADAKIHK